MISRGCERRRLATVKDQFDRIQAGQEADALYAYLNHIQVNVLGMPSSDAFKEIVDRSVALVRIAG